MAEKYDLRVARTYKLLNDAFKELMEKKEFDEISVNELCEKAMIRRTTFYKHFADKYDYLRFFLRSMLDDMESKNLSMSELNDIHSYCLTVARSIFEFVEKDRKLITNAINSQLLPMFLSIMYERIITDFINKLKQAQKREIKIPASPEVTATFFSGAVMNTIGLWINDDLHLTSEEIIEQLDLLLKVWD